MLKKVNNPLVEQLIIKIRNPVTGRRLFRQSIQKIGQFAALEISNYLQTTQQKIMTVLGQIATHQVLKQQPVLITVLRAGIPFHSGILRIFADSQSGFIGAKRNQQTLKPELSYIAVPDVNGKTVLIADTMLATGGTFLQAIKYAKKGGASRIIVAAVIAAEYGIKAIKDLDQKIDIFYAALDPTLNDKGYIVPGLGDAGDRSFGLKL